MIIQQIRNDALKIEYNGISFLIDPWLQDQGTGFSVKAVTAALAAGGMCETLPEGACRELMVQLMPTAYKDIEIMLDYEEENVITLGDLTPEWWIG